jgi:putrescine transport system substrate-binding protein
LASVKKYQLFGIKVRCDTFGINEIVRDKRVAGKSGDDIVVPTSGWARLQMDCGLLRNLDTSPPPHLKNLDPDIQAQNAQAVINGIMR